MKEVFDVLTQVGPYAVAVILWMWKESERGGREKAEAALRAQGEDGVRALNENTSALGALRRALFPRREDADDR